MRKRAITRQSEVLKVLRASDRPMSAYQVLGELQSDEPDIAPPTVYRALAALTDQGRAHRLESLKAFVPCRCDHTDSLPILAICGECGSVEEHDGVSLMPKLDALIRPSAFTPDRHIVEIQGTCGHCTNLAPAFE